MKLKIAVIWTEVPGYLAACLRFLQQNYDVELLVIRNLADRPNSTRRFFDESLFSWMRAFHTVNHPDFRVRLGQMRDLVWQFEPDGILLAFQWRYVEDYFLVRDAKQKGVPVVGCMDNIWLDNLKQRLTVVASRALSIMPLDAVWVPGERASEYARRLFGSEIPIWRGLNTADTTLFGPDQMGHAKSERLGRFLYVGRFSTEKGIWVLLEAYRRYRARADQDIWHLHLVGDGPLLSAILESEIDGIEISGFKQPKEIKQLMERSSVLILPSNYEAWGVVLHEAALQGLPILCSHRCGASVELIQHGFNGLVHQAGDVDTLSSQMLGMSAGNYDLQKMSQNSICMSKRYSCDLWAATLTRGLNRLRKYRTLEEQ